MHTKNPMRLSAEELVPLRAAIDGYVTCCGGVPPEHFGRSNPEAHLAMRRVERELEDFLSMAILHARATRTNTVAR